MDEDNRDPEPATMSREALIDEVIRLRAQVAEDQDYYRKCRDMMADKLHSYNDKFNLQEEVIHDLTKEVENLQSSTEMNENKRQGERGRVPQLSSQAQMELARFDADKLF